MMLDMESITFYVYWLQQCHPYAEPIVCIRYLSAFSVQKPHKGKLRKKGLFDSQFEGLLPFKVGKPRQECEAAATLHLHSRAEKKMNA